MKKILIPCFILMFLSNLTATAYADVIVEPGEIFLATAGGMLPLLLVLAAVVVSAVLLQNFRKKR